MLQNLIVNLMMVRVVEPTMLRHNVFEFYWHFFFADVDDAVKHVDFRILGAKDQRKVFTDCS
jgi:hypothetical protein